MKNVLTIDPISRIEGHLAIRVEIEANRVVKAYSSGEMFRGFEVILKGRDPLDAQQITQRICGVCPISHGMASVLAQEDAYNIQPPSNGRIARNIVLAANYIQSHIIHFYHLSALDFVDIAAITKYKGHDPLLSDLKLWVTSQLSSNSLYPAAPFLPRYKGDYITETELNIQAIHHYLQALKMRSLAHKMAAVLGGKLPHSTTFVPGGITEKITAATIGKLTSMIRTLQGFIDTAYIPDVVEVAKSFPDYFRLGRGCENFMAYGVFDESDDRSRKFFPAGIIVQGEKQAFESRYITEDVRYSMFSSDSGRHPIQGKTTPDPNKLNAYSWIKAPRYNNTVMEVGPLARVLVARTQRRNGALEALLNYLFRNLSLKPGDMISAMGRHAARAAECKLIADRLPEWIAQLSPGKPVYNDHVTPQDASGEGLSEAPRGALGHWVAIKNAKIENYQCIVPTTWNCSPRDDAKTPGAVEQALVGTPVADPKNPIEAARVVRSFDPCIACAVH